MLIWRQERKETQDSNTKIQTQSYLSGKGVLEL